MEIDGRTEGRAKSDAACLSEPGAQERVPEGMEEPVSGGQATPAGCSGDTGWGEEGTMEGHGEVLMEKPLSEAGLRETEQAAVGSVTDNSLTSQAGALVPETLDLLSDHSGRRTPVDLLCGQEPDRVLSASLGVAMEIDPKALSAAVPGEPQGGRDACATDFQGSASGNEGDVEMLPPRDTRLLATDCPLGSRCAGSVDPAGEDASWAELSFTKVGTQTGGAEEREMGPVVTEAGEERGTSRVSAVLQRCDPGMNTHQTEEALLPQLSMASASDFPPREINSEGAFSREGTVTVAASCHVTQENLSSEDLLETCQEDTAWPAAAPPAGLALGKGLVPVEPLAAYLREPLLDWGGNRVEECLSPRSEAGTEGEQEGLAVEGELECGRPGGTKPDPAAKGQLPACSLGYDEAERRKGDGAALILACASPAAAPGGKEPDSLGGRETKGPEEAGQQWLFQRSEKGGGCRLESENSRLLPQQDEAQEEEEEANLNNEIQVTSQSCSVGTKPVEDAQRHHETAEPEQNDSHVERWTGCLEGSGMSSGPSTQSGCQADSPLPQDRPEPERPAGEPRGLGNNPEVEPQGADVGKGPFSPEDLPGEGSAWEEVGPADVAVEGSAPPRPDGCSGEVVSSEQGDALQQSPEDPSCGEDKGEVSLGFCAAASSETSTALPESTATCLPQQSQADSTGVPESSSNDELNLHISDSEVQREENDKSQSQREAVIRKERDVLISDSVKPLDGGTEGGEAWGKRTERWATQGPGEAANQETGSGPSRAAGTPAQQNSACDEPCGDHSPAAVAVPETAVTDVAAAGKPPAVVRAAAVREELGAQAAKGTGLVPLNLSCVSEEDSHPLESYAKLGEEEQAPSGVSGAAEEVGAELLEGSGRLGSKLAGQPGGERLEVEEPPEERLQNEIPAGVCAEKVERAQKTKEEAPLCLPQEMGTWQPRENTSRSENDPGCSKWLQSPECGRSPFPAEEEAEGCSSRKRHFSKDQPLGMVDSGHDSCSQKRLRLLDSGSDLPSAPMDLERHRDQFSRTIGKFLQQYSSQIALPSDEKEEKNRDSIAQIVRAYFNGTFGLEEPEAATLEVDMPALPLEARMSGEVDWDSAARSEAERRAAGEEAEPSLASNAEPEVNPVECQDLSLHSECSLPSSPSHSSGSHTQQPGQELAHHDPESAWDPYFSEEEEFQSSISSMFLSSPVVSPEAQCGQEPCGKRADFVFSDISNSSAESEHWENPPKPGHRSSRGMGSGRLHGMLSEAAEVDLASSGGACRSPEPADVGWCEEETSAPSGMHASSPERVPIPEADSRVEPGDRLDAVGEDLGAPVLQQADGTFDGEDGREASERAASCVSSPSGGAREESDDGTSKMQIEDGAFLQRSHEDSLSQEPECKPAIHRPSDSTLWDRPAPCVKAEPAPCHARELSDEDGNASPSRTAAVIVTPEPVGCPTSVVDTWGEDSILWSSSLSRVTPSPGQTPACSQARNSSSLNGSCLLRSVKQEGRAKTVDADAHGKLQSREDGSSLSPLPPRGPPGLADDPEEEGFGKGLARDLGRSGERWPGQTDASRAAQGDAGDMGKSAGPLLTVGAGGHQMAICSSLVQEGAPGSIRLPSLPSVPRLIKEEPDPCDSHVQVAGFSPRGGYPTATSPVIPVLQKPRMAEASENWVPESPVGCSEEDWLLDKDEAPGQPDTACVQSGDEHAPCMEAEEGPSSTLTVSPGVSEPPPQRNPWRAHEDGSAQNTSASSAAGAESSPRKPWASSEQEVAFQLQECQSVLEEISRSLSGVEGIDDVHMKRWREQLAELQKATKLPRTCIAVVGNTGAGKSSLLNALLDEEAVLPTSAMRACTAVVVEISRAAGSSPYEADVEFLSEEEWYKELAALLEDMKDKSGNLKRRCPDRKAEARAAYSRVKAVYGTVDEVASLRSMQDVTQHLGTVKRISAETAADFRVNIEKFIDSRTDNLRDMKGGEFWPIVKCVKIRVARAEALKTGVVLVDLPGIRDSNAARDNAAKEYLKTCHAVWVVASITRAVDDKTAKAILNSNLRRQLFMDGQYGNLAFVCTKTDSFNISDIVRDLDLREEIQPLEEELEVLESQRLQAQEEKGALHTALHLEQRPGAEAADPAWLQRQHNFLEKEFRLSALQKQKDAKLHAIGLICVQARNRFSKQRIRMDFNAGLERLKRKAEFSECDDDGDEDMEDGDFASSDLGDLGEAESQHEKLHVFTVSSTEYLKLSGKLLRDGPPQVFHDPKDTEIPALKNFAIETGLKASMKATEKVIRDVARVISQIVHYLTNQRAEDVSHQAQVQEMVQRALQDVPRLLQEAVDDVLPDIQFFFGVLIQTSLRKGSHRAKELCEDIVKSWGSPVSGFPHSTYHAACLRRGVYASPKYGDVDFNEQLANPLNEAIAGAWSGVFSSKVEESLERFTKAVLDKLKLFFQELKRNVGQQSGLTEALGALHFQQMEAVQARLRNFLLDQEAFISQRQRSISRMLTPAIQAGMDTAYAACTQMSGPGYFQRMKDTMERHIRNNKDPIFDAAIEKLQDQLHLLQKYIQGSFQSLVQELNKSLQMQFEPLLKPVQKNAEIIPDLMKTCTKVDKICKRSCVGYVLPSAPQAEASSLGTETEPRENPWCFSASRLDIRLGAVPLPRVAAIQQSAYDAEPLREVPAAVSVPPRSPRGVSVVQQPPLPPVSLLPYGRKRAGEAGPALLEKRHKNQAGSDHAGLPLPSSYSWSSEGKMAPCEGRATLCSLPTSGVCFQEDCTQQGAWLRGAAQHRTPAGELVARPGCAGAPVRAEEGSWGKRCDPSSKGDRDQTLKTQPVESSEEAHPAGSSWLIR